MNALRLPALDPDEPSAPFPKPSESLRQPNGLLAVGGCLSPKRLLNAYRAGIFPWYDPDQSILWWSPDPRTVFATDAVHVSRSLQRQIRKADYAVTLDRAFSEVITCCAAMPRPGQDGTWLGRDMRAAFTALHRIGYAHSVEVWRHGHVVGGVYGVATGRIFFGESMFSVEPNGSKLALAHLAEQLAAWDFPIIDGQIGSPHLYRMGAFDLPRPAFLELLAENTSRPGAPGPWNFDISVPYRARHLP